jgi:2-polyprenyl-6-methoxyphenol hydroxylase-like FAD-dependent oxidoreductase
MLGYLLARAGIGCVVLEKWPDFFRDFRGDTIHPSTMDVLHELGLLEEFLALPHNRMTQMKMHIGGVETVVADLRHLHTVSPFIAFIAQWDFLNFMTEQARKFPSFTLMMSTEATGVIRDGRCVAGVEAKGPGGKIAIHADLVIGADGRHSAMREHGGFPIEDLGVPIDVLWFRIGKSGEDDEQSLGYLSSCGALVMLDRRDYWQCACIIEKDGFDRVKAAGLPAFRDSIARAAHLSGQAVAEVDTWDKVKLLSVTVDHALTWAKDGIVLIGDAAHAMSPIGGVGINYAIQDAVAAANLLVPALRKGRPDLATLSRVQARRQRPVLKMQRIQVYMHDHLLFPFITGARTRAPWFVRLFLWFPILRRIPAKVIGIGFLPEHVDMELLHSS